MHDLISIIIPVYKVEPYLNRCINSVVNQSYKNIEVILIDDGSPDHCPQICDEWVEKDERVIAVHKKNGGLSDARNCGLNLAKGKYVCFIDSDDYVASTFVEVLYEMINKKQILIAAVGIKKVYDDVCNEIKNMSEREIRVFSGESAIEQLFYDNTYCNFACNKMFDRILFQKIKFPFGRKMEDLGTTYKLIIQSGGIAYCPDTLYFYYQRSDSILHNTDINFFKDKLFLSFERYMEIKKLYPNLYENYKFFLEVLLEAYPFLYEPSNENEWKVWIKDIFNQCKKSIDTKTKLKFWLVNMNSRLYRSFMYHKKANIVQSNNNSNVI